MPDERLTEIETKLAFQEQALSELTRSMLELEKRTGKIEAALERLAKKVNETTDDAPEIGPQDDPPPHY